MGADVYKRQLEADELLKQEKFIKNPWLGIFDSLAQWRTHLSRKQNQLYPMLEEHGFDRPTRIMWTFDDGVRDAISASYALLREDKYEEFLASVPETLEKLRDLNSKELEVLLPTSYKPVSYTHLLAKTFYPEEFKDVDPEGTLKEFYDKFLPFSYGGVWFMPVSYTHLHCIIKNT